jgi:hypothetical protein
MSSFQNVCGAIELVLRSVLNLINYTINAINCQFEAVFIYKRGGDFVDIVLIFCYSIAVLFFKVN